MGRLKQPVLDWPAVQKLVYDTKLYVDAGWVPAAQAISVISASECPTFAAAGQVNLHFRGTAQEDIAVTTRALVPQWAVFVAKCGAMFAERRYWLSHLQWHPGILDAVGGAGLLQGSAPYTAVCDILRSQLPCPNAEFENEARRARQRVYGRWVRTR
jgi:hypothetical protein